MPLVGELSVAQLAELVQETMPGDNPGSLSVQESEAVAAYIHNEFYSLVARARNQPARIELARLTVRQFQQTMADLIGSFREPAKWGDQRGLSADYYEGRRIGGRRGKAASRIDAQIDFDFDTEAPVPEITEPHAFSIRWDGSVLARVTGEYEFVVRTEHAARLWINDPDNPLIDAWVKSGDELEYQASLFLIEGRAYPLRLEFTKAKQGVNDSKDEDEPPPSPPASIALLWKRPHGVLEPIPQRQLSPEAVPKSFVCTTPFPPDDRSYGWERGTAVSEAWYQATINAAIEAAAFISDNLNEFANTRDKADDRDEKLRSFCRRFAERAFRRPLNDSEAEELVNSQFQAAEDVEAAVRRVVLRVLNSPQFLFRELACGSAPFDVASRLSFGLWDSLPDDELVQAAVNSKLNTKEQVAAQAERMLGDLRARAKIRNFLLTWLHADSHSDLDKDREKYPEFDAAAVADLRTSLELFLDDVVWSESSDFRQLLLADGMFLNDRLAKIYALESNCDSAFIKTRFDAGERSGVLTHPYLMANFAHRNESSPIHRGVFLARGVLGQMLRPPPEAVTPISPDLHPELTTRERVALQTKAANCRTCHGIINPLGFTLEHFDAIGRYRKTDRDKSVDASGSYLTRSGERISLNGARDLAEFLANSEEAHAAFVQQFFQHLVQQPIQAYGPTALVDLRESFVENKFKIRTLAVDIMVASALLGRETDAVKESRELE